MFTLSPREVLYELCPRRFSIWGNFTMSLLAWGFTFALFHFSPNNDPFPGFLIITLLCAGSFGSDFSSQFRLRRKIRKLQAQIEAHQPLKQPEPPAEAAGTTLETPAFITPESQPGSNNPPPIHKGYKP